MFDRKKGFHLSTIVFLMTFSFPGLLCSAIIDQLFFKGNEAETPSLLIVTQIFFGSIWGFTLAVIVPIQILYFRRKNLEDASLPSATVKDLLALPFGACNPDAKLPRWIAVPVLAFLWLLVAIFLIIVSLGLLVMFIHKFFPE